jgi:hypothetical protein
VGGVLLFAAVAHNVLLVGYGDYSPVTIAGRVLLFPIVLLGIAMLGSLIEMIVTFFSHRVARCKAESRGQSERQRPNDGDKRQNLADMIELLERLNERLDTWDQVRKFFLSYFGFLRSGFLVVRYSEHLR